MRLKEQQEIVAKHGLREEDAATWYTKYYKHTHHARERGLQSELSFDQYLRKITEGGISTPEQIGRRLDQFQLGRIGDAGDYTDASCRFITTEQNHREKQENGRNDYAAMARTVTGRTKENHAGKRAQADKLAREFRLVDPQGNVHCGKNLFEFAQQNGLCARNLYLVFAGRRKHHKGWTGNYLD